MCSHFPLYEVRITHQLTEGHDDRLHSCPALNNTEGSAVSPPRKVLVASMIASLFSHVGSHDSNSRSSGNNNDEEQGSFETAKEFSAVVDAPPPNKTNSIHIDATYIKQGSQFYFDFDNQDTSEDEQREGSIGKLPLTPDTNQSASSACSSESVSTLSVNNNDDDVQKSPHTDLFSCYEMGELCHIFMGFGFVTSIVTLIVLVILEPFGDVYEDDGETDDEASPQFEYNMIWYVLISIGAGVIVVCTCPFLARIAQVILIIQELVSKTIHFFQRMAYVCGIGNRRRNHNSCCCCCFCC